MPQARQVPLGQRGQPVQRVLPAQQEPQAPLEQPERPEQRVRRDQPVPQAPWALLARLA